MKLARIILPTSKPRELAGFLSEFLDLEVSEVAGQYEMLFGAQYLVVVLGDDKAAHATSLEFSVETKEELDQLWQKYQFTLYRHADNAVSGAKPPHEVENKFIFEAIDIDGRSWRFVWEQENA